MFKIYRQGRIIWNFEFYYQMVTWQVGDILGCKSCGCCQWATCRSHNWHLKISQTSAWIWKNYTWNIVIWQSSGTMCSVMCGASKLLISLRTRSHILSMRHSQRWGSAVSLIQMVTERTLITDVLKASHWFT